MRLSARGFCPLTCDYCREDCELTVGKHCALAYMGALARVRMTERREHEREGDGGPARDRR